ncbi:MAG: PorT family protein [Prevotella sp.]|nr:PorT family protein [Prevotella sp.]
MRKIYAVFVLLAAMMMAQSAQAQASFGVRGGLNVSNMSLDKDVFNVSNRAGFFIGPSVKLGFGSIGADISALYDQREAKVNEETIKQKSIVIPVNARFNIGMGAASAFIAAGPQFGFNVGDDEFTFKDLKGSSETAQDKFQLKKSNFSVNVGGGVHFGKLDIGLVYNIAVGKTADVDAKGAFDTTKDAIKNFDAKNNAWQIYAAYYF